MSRRSCLVCLLGIAVTGAASAQPAPPAADPVADRIAAINEAVSTLQKANAARQKGQRSFAEQLFSNAENLIGMEALAELAPLFREGAPPRVTTPLKVMPKDTPAQPAAVGSSEEEEPEPPKPKRGAIAGTVKLGAGPLVGRGVVTVEPAQGRFRPRPPKARVMEQRNRDFAPKILVVRLGSTVSFPNFDSVFHNVYSRSEAKAFDLGIYKNGQSRDLTFDKEGIVRVGCNLHANMSGYIVVVNAPHYAITDDKGAFSFKGLPPGKYRVRAFSERSQSPAVQEVTVAPDATATVTLAVTADAAPPSLDKFGTVRGK